MSCWHRHGARAAEIYSNFLENTRPQLELMEMVSARGLNAAALRSASWIEFIGSSLPHHPIAGSYHPCLCVHIHVGRQLMSNSVSCPMLLLLMRESNQTNSISSKGMPISYI